ncbi:hypothetical protein F2Q70_00040650 [Brassica cretica]|uniref:Uncharacterized protein n=1 Tax=Brassica cretica TaxID=69181 RepID=A0A8S9K8X5_BRACR|nr:hypothetical protein F2Q70_00040650 [Brassica cretica]
MQNVWSVPCCFSGLNPPSAAAGDPPGRKSQWLQLILLLLGATLPHVTVTNPNPEASLMENFTTLPPKSSSPLHTNPTSSPHVPSHNLTPINQTALPQNLVHVPPDTSTNQTSSVQQPSSSPTLVERIRLSEDKTL